MYQEEWLEKLGVSDEKLQTYMNEHDLEFSKEDMAAAWETYIELLTIIPAQPIKGINPLESAALAGVYSFFQTTRDVMKRHGSGCFEFARITTLVLNQKIKPFTFKWYKRSLNGRLRHDHIRKVFWQEVKELTVVFMSYMQILADIGGFDDISGQDIRK